MTSLRGFSFWGVPLLCQLLDCGHGSSNRSTMLVSTPGTRLQDELNGVIENQRVAVVATQPAFSNPVLSEN